MRRPTLREIECFAAVAEELNFSRAARRIHLSQPPLSRHIRQLEEAVGTVLLIRDKRSVSLTAAGRLFLADAREILVRMDRASETARRAGNGEPRRLTLGFVGALLAPDLIESLRQFRNEHPNVQVQLVDALPASQFAALADGSLDGAFPGAMPKRMAKTLSGAIWKKEALLVGFPEDHPLAAASPGRVTLKALRNESWVMISRSAGPAFREQMDDLCSAAGFRPRITQESERVQAVLSMVAAGAGVSLFPETVTQLIRKGVVFKPLASSKATLGHAFVWPNNRVSPELDAFRKLILARSIRSGSIS